MPATRHRFPCQHKGFGSFKDDDGVICHRCREANRLEKSKDSKLSPEDKKAEVTRLRGPQKKKGTIQNFSLPT